MLVASLLAKEVEYPLYRGLDKPHSRSDLCAENIGYFPAWNWTPIAEFHVRSPIILRYMDCVAFNYLHLYNNEHFQPLSDIAGRWKDLIKGS
jgi:hypothetical protein